MQVPESASGPASPDPSTLGPSLSASTFELSFDPSTFVPPASDALEASAGPFPVTLPPQPQARKLNMASPIRIERAHPDAPPNGGEDRSTHGA
jgi:hypothetical protein